MDVNEVHENKEEKKNTTKRNNRRVCSHLLNFFSTLTGDPIIMTSESVFCDLPRVFRLGAIVAHRPHLNTETALGKTHVLPDLTVEMILRPYFIEVRLGHFDVHLLRVWAATWASMATSTQLACRTTRHFIHIGHVPLPNRHFLWIGEQIFPRVRHDVTQLLLVLKPSHYGEE